MKFSEILDGAKSYIPRMGYICHSVEAYCNIYGWDEGKPVLEEEADSIKQEIMKRIFPHDTFSEWLAATDPDRYVAEMDKDRFLVDSRIQLMDSLIDFYKERGN